MSAQRGHSHITVVNDSAEFLLVIKEMLTEEAGYHVTTIDEDVQGIEAIRGSHPDLLIIDLRASGWELKGWDILQSIRADPGLRRLPVIVCSGDVQWLREHADDLARDPDVRALPKPFGIDELVSMLESMLH